MDKKHFDFKLIVFLNFFLLFNSLLATCSKFASQEKFLSMRFLMYYGIALINMGIYAIVWQQLIKRMPLTTAYSNKAIGMMWALLWGKMFFSEVITIWKLVGVVVIIIGVILVVTEDAIKENH